MCDQATIRVSWEVSSAGIIAVDDLRLHENRCEHNPQDPEAVHDFEENGSSFASVLGSEVDWDTMSVGVQTDHTLGTLKGKTGSLCIYVRIEILLVGCHLARVDLSKHTAGQLGQIVSPLYLAKGKIYNFFHFYYYVSDVSNSATLRGYLRHTEDGSGVALNMTKTQYFLHKGDQRDSWVRHQGYMNSSGNFQFVFEAELVKNDSKAVIGIDDLYFTTGGWVLSTFCDFEHDMCSWTNEHDDDLDWELRKPTDLVTGPPVDHSENSVTGHYVSIVGSYMPEGGGFANLVSEWYQVQQPNRGSCFMFWYNAAFTNGSLTVSAEREAAWQTVWKLESGVDTAWHFAAVSLHQTEMFRLVMTGMLPLHSDIYIALDYFDYLQFDKCPNEEVIPSIADVVAQDGKNMSGLLVGPKLSIGWGDQCLVFWYQIGRQKRGRGVPLTTPGAPGSPSEVLQLGEETSARACRAGATEVRVGLLTGHRVPRLHDVKV
ncbi:MAM and LDL-receptor class A domain-containing protein 1 [Chionoecetes opilio]|uniref:MAM and LDL-receptor class A domain-containing protein 1 n=1 Tax=Chionoecetes opilio TaxID=41210 RepID=A0A8J5D5H1_CHIOP|nr:MAM and LDL-receptor class A domain-containing protein 1 [Chionoecetes opilio]